MTIYYNLLHTDLCTSGRIVIGFATAVAVVLAVTMASSRHLIAFIIFFGCAFGLHNDKPSLLSAAT